MPNWWDEDVSNAASAPPAPLVQLGKTDATAQQALVDQATKANKLADLGQQYVTANAVDPDATGPINSLGFHLPQWLGGAGFNVGDMRANTNPTTGRLSELSKRMIPLQRDVGAGPIRIGEVSGPGGGIWGGDVPRINAAAPVSAAIASDWQTNAAYDRALRDWATSWGQNKGTLAGAQTAFDKWWPGAVAQKAQQRQAANAALTAQSNTARQQNDPVNLFGK
jgi:hypothetical protein